MVEAWSYGDAGDRWPVQPGEVWEVGPHVLACGDIERGDALALIDRYGKPDLTYTDPPWGLSATKAFRTKAGQMMPLNADFCTLINKIMLAASHTKDEVWVEMGCREQRVLLDAIKATGGHVRGIFDITYDRLRPAKLICARYAPKVDISLLEIDNPQGMDDTKTPAWVMSHRIKEGLIFDPCTGQGRTALATDAAGLRFLGLELHPRRLAVTIDQLVKRRGYTPHRVDAFIRPR